MTETEWLECVDKANTLLKKVELDVTGQDSTTVMIFGLHTAATAAAILSQGGYTDASSLMRLVDDVFTSYYIGSVATLNISPPPGSKQ